MKLANGVPYVTKKAELFRFCWQNRSISRAASPSTCSEIADVCAARINWLSEPQQIHPNKAGTQAVGAKAKRRSIEIYVAFTGPWSALYLALCNARTIISIVLRLTTRQIHHGPKVPL